MHLKRVGVRTCLQTPSIDQRLCYSLRMGSELNTPSKMDDDEVVDAHLVQWLEAMSAGDEGALGDFYDATLAKVYGVAIRVLGDPALAEDVVTDVYHDAWTKAATFDASRGAPLAWLLRICRNRALDRYRHENSVNRTAEAAAAQTVVEPVEKPDSLLESIEEGHAVQTLLASISSEDRQLIALAFFRGYTHEQIAHATSIPLGTVKSRIRRVLKTLQKSAPDALLAGRA